MADNEKEIFDLDSLREQLVIELDHRGFKDAIEDADRLIHKYRTQGFELDHLCSKYGSLKNVAKKLIDQEVNDRKNSDKSLKDQEKSLKKLGSQWVKNAGYVSDYSSLFSGIGGGLRSLIVPTSFLGAMKETIEYDKSIISLSASINRLGIGNRELENQLIGIGYASKLTRKDIIGLFDSYQMGMRVIDLSEFENSLKRLKNMVGSNQQEMQKYFQTISSISQKYPELASSLLRIQNGEKELGKIQKERIAAQVRNLYMIGQISQEEYRRTMAYIRGNEQMSEEDRKRQQEQQERIALLQDLKRQIESVALTFGNILLPPLQELADYLTRVSEGMDRFKISGSDAVRTVVGSLALLKGLMMASSLAKPIAIPLSIKASKGVLKMLGGGAAAAAGASKIGGGAALAGVGAKTGVVALKVKGLAAASALAVKAAVPLAVVAGAYTAVAAARAYASEDKGFFDVIKEDTSLLKRMWDSFRGKEVDPIDIKTRFDMPDNIKEVYDSIQARDGDAISKEAVFKEKYGKDIEQPIQITLKNILETKKRLEEELKPLEKRRMELLPEVNENALSAVRNYIKNNAEGIDIDVNIRGGEDSTKTLDRIKSDIEKKIDVLNKTVDSLRDRGEHGEAKQAGELVKKHEEILSTIEKQAEAERKKHSEYEKTISHINSISSELDDQESRHERIIGLLAMQKNVVEGLGSLYAAQTGSIGAMIEKMSILGQIDPFEAFSQIGDAMKTLDAQVEAAKNYQQQLVLNRGLIEQNKGKTVEEVLAQQDLTNEAKVFFKELKGIGIDRLSQLDVEKALVDQQKTINNALKERTELALSIKNITQDSERLTSTEAQMYSTLVGLADNFAIGVGASAQMRMDAFRAEEKNIQVLRKRWAMQKQMISSGNDNLRTRTELKQTEIEILNAQQRQAQQVKSLRDHWVSAIGAMNTGSDTLAEIVMNVEQNTAQALRLGAIRSASSGAFAQRDRRGRATEHVGFMTSERLSAQGGGMNIRSSSGRDPFSISYRTPTTDALMGAGGQRGPQMRMRMDMSNMFEGIRKQSHLTAQGGAETLGASGHPMVLGAYVQGKTGRDALERGGPFGGREESQSFGDSPFKTTGFIKKGDEKTKDYFSVDGYQISKGEVIPVFVVNFKDALKGDKQEKERRTTQEDGREIGSKNIHEPQTTQIMREVESSIILPSGISSEGLEKFQETIRNIGVDEIKSSTKKQIYNSYESHLDNLYSEVEKLNRSYVESGGDDEIAGEIKKIGREIIQTKQYQLEFSKSIGDTNSFYSREVFEAFYTGNIDTLKNLSDDFINSHIDLIKEQNESLKEQLRNTKRGSQEQKRTLDAIQKTQAALYVAGAYKSQSQRIPLASGGIVTSPTHALIGESGPEAVIPIKNLDSLVEKMYEMNHSNKDSGNINLEVNIPNSSFVHNKVNEKDIESNRFNEFNNSRVNESNILSDINSVLNKNIEDVNSVNEVSQFIQSKFSEFSNLSETSKVNESNILSDINSVFSRNTDNITRINDLNKLVEDRLNDVSNIKVSSVSTSKSSTDRLNISDINNKREESYSESYPTSSFSSMAATIPTPFGSIPNPAMIASMGMSFIPKIVSPEIAPGVATLNSQILKSIFSGIVPLASGGIVTSPTHALIGEAGPEAVIPIKHLDSLVERMYKMNHFDRGIGNLNVAVNIPSHGADDSLSMATPFIPKIISPQSAPGITPLNSQILKSLSNGIVPLASGGFIEKATLAIVGESGPEVVLNQENIKHIINQNLRINTMKEGVIRIQQIPSGDIINEIIQDSLRQNEYLRTQDEIRIAKENNLSRKGSRVQKSMISKNPSSTRIPSPRSAPSYVPNYPPSYGPSRVIEMTDPKIFDPYIQRRSAEHYLRPAVARPKLSIEQYRSMYGASSRGVGGASGVSGAAKSGGHLRGLFHGSSSGAAKSGGLLGKISHGVRGKAGIASLASAAASYGAGHMEQREIEKGNEEGAAKWGIGKGIANISGSVATGAFIGSVIPGIGTGVGAIAGGIIGTIKYADEIQEHINTLNKDIRENSKSFQYKTKEIEIENEKCRNAYNELEGTHEGFSKSIKGLTHNVYGWNLSFSRKLKDDEDVVKKLFKGKTIDTPEGKITVGMSSRQIKKAQKEDPNIIGISSEASYEYIHKMLNLMKQDPRMIGEDGSERIKQFLNTKIGGKTASEMLNIGDGNKATFLSRTNDLSVWSSLNTSQNDSSSDVDAVPTEGGNKLQVQDSAGGNGYGIASIARSAGTGYGFASIARSAGFQGLTEPLEGQSIPSFDGRQYDIQIKSLNAQISELTEHIGKINNFEEFVNSSDREDSLIVNARMAHEAIKNKMKEAKGEYSQGKISEKEYHHKILGFKERQSNIWKGTEVEDIENPYLTNDSEPVFIEDAHSKRFELQGQRGQVEVAKQRDIRSSIMQKMPKEVDTAKGTQAYLDGQRTKIIEARSMHAKLGSMPQNNGEYKGLTDLLGDINIELPEGVDIGNSYIRGLLNDSLKAVDSLRREVAKELQIQDSVVKTGYGQEEQVRDIEDANDTEVEEIPAEIQILKDAEAEFIEKFNSMMLPNSGKFKEVRDLINMSIKEKTEAIEDLNKRIEESKVYDIAEKRRIINDFNDQASPHMSIIQELEEERDLNGHDKIVGLSDKIKIEEAKINYIAESTGYNRMADSELSPDNNAQNYEGQRDLLMSQLNQHKELLWEAMEREHEIEKNKKEEEGESYVPRANREFSDAVDLEHKTFLEYMHPTRGNDIPVGIGPVEVTQFEEELHGNTEHSSPNPQKQLQREERKYAQSHAKQWMVDRKSQSDEINAKAEEQRTFHRATGRGSNFREIEENRREEQRTLHGKIKSENESLSKLRGELGGASIGQILSDANLTMPQLLEIAQKEERVVEDEKTITPSDRYKEIVKFISEGSSPEFDLERNVARDMVFPQSQVTTENLPDVTSSAPSIVPQQEIGGIQTADTMPGNNIYNVVLPGVNVHVHIENMDQFARSVEGQIVPALQQAIEESFRTVLA